jgi:hypothetical protein
MPEILRANHKGYVDSSTLHGSIVQFTNVKIEGLHIPDVSFNTLGKSKK